MPNKPESTRRIRDPKVAATFEAYPAALRDKLLGLRQLVFDTAEGIEGVGELDETLKWGQPSYLTPSKSGSTIRIDALKDGSGYAMYFHCQTNLVETFRELYPTQFNYEGNRAIHFGAADRISSKALTHCVGLALTYHARQKAKVAEKTAKKSAIRRRAPRS